jgi:putative addiction module component (TIGR02574 family)
MPRKITVTDTLEMSPVERFQLAQEILGTLDEDFVDDAERALIEERLQSYHANPAAVRSWDEVRRDIFGK